MPNAITEGISLVLPRLYGGVGVVAPVLQMRGLRRPQVKVFALDHTL